MREGAGRICVLRGVQGLPRARREATMNTKAILTRISRWVLLLSMLAFVVGVLALGLGRRGMYQRWSSDMTDLLHPSSLDDKPPFAMESPQGNVVVQHDPEYGCVAVHPADGSASWKICNGDLYCTTTHPQTAIEVSLNRNASIYFVGLMSECDSGCCDMFGFHMNETGHRVRDGFIDRIEPEIRFFNKLTFILGVLLAVSCIIRRPRAPWRYLMAAACFGSIAVHCITIVM
jgi:hypothetical protein